MTAAGRALPERLTVAADLTVAVRAPDGGTASLRLTGEQPPLRLEVTGLGALRRSLPGRAAVPGGDVRRATALLQRVLDQVPEHVRRDVLGVDLDVVVAGRRVAQRRGGRWRPDRTTTAVAAAGAVAAVAAAGGAVAVLVGLLVAAVRALRGVRPRG